MKRPLTLVLLSAICFLPATAQTPPTDDGSKAADQTLDPAALKKKLRDEEQAREDKIKGMEKKVAWEPTNKDNRLALVDYLESLAQESEKKDDWPGAWRFYQRAAAALRDPKVDEWEKRAEGDSAKAALFRHKQTDRVVAEEEARALARRMRDAAIVAPSSDWHAKKDVEDSFAENRYRESVFKRVQNAWVNSSLRKAVTDTKNFVKPAEISFDVHSDGEVSDIKITSSSGDRRIDLAALKVVEDLGRVDPLLPGMGQLVRFHTEFGK
jgi:TonB family protein